MVTQPQEHAHPGPREYVLVGVILAIITAAEVTTFYLHIPLLVLIPVLLVLAAIKFALVVMFFMHLKFDPRLFTGLVLFGLVRAGALLTAMLVRPISAM
jgi:cytochrome c oxidase subunit 4